MPLVEGVLNWRLDSRPRRSFRQRNVSGQRAVSSIAFWSNRSWRSKDLVDVCRIPGRRKSAMHRTSMELRSSYSTARTIVAWTRRCQLRSGRRRNGEGKLAWKSTSSARVEIVFTHCRYRVHRDRQLGDITGYVGGRLDVVLHKIRQGSGGPQTSGAGGGNARGDISKWVAQGTKWTKEAANGRADAPPETTMGFLVAATG